MFKNLQGKRLPLEVRERIVADRMNGLSVKEISAKYDVPGRSVYKILEIYRETGSAAERKAGGQTVLSAEEISSIGQLLAANPKITGEAVKARLGIKAAIPTIYRAMRIAAADEWAKTRHLTPETAELMRKDRENGMKRADIIVKYGFSRRIVDQALKGSPSKKDA